MRLVIVLLTPLLIIFLVGFLSSRESYLLSSCKAKNGELVRGKEDFVCVNRSAILIIK